jgi:hypothetical protein
LRDAKRILRAAIDECLDGRTLKSRDVALAMRRREAAHGRDLARRNESLPEEYS